MRAQNQNGNRKTNDLEVETCSDRSLELNEFEESLCWIGMNGSKTTQSRKKTRLNSEPVASYPHNDIGDQHLREDATYHCE